MKNYVLFVFLLLSALGWAQSNDTLTIDLSKNLNLEDDTQMFQSALHTLTPKVLKINVKKGTYMISSSLSSGKNNTYLKFEKGSEIHFLSNTAGFIVTHDNFVVDGASFIGNGQSAKDLYSGNAIMLMGTDQVVIKNSQFNKISGNGIFLYPANSSKGCTNTQIINNSFTNPIFDLGGTGDESAILLGYSGKNYMHNNNIIRNNNIDGGNILKLGIGIIGHGTNNIIENNFVSNCRSYGIVVYESVYEETNLHDNKILNNVVKNVGEVGNKKTVKGMCIYLFKSYNSVVSGNSVSNCLRNSDETETLSPGAISLSQAENSVIKDNLINGSYMYGITTDYSFGTKIMNNTIENIRKSGAYFINENDILVQNNIFKNIGDVVLKGYFENTSLPSILEQPITAKYKHIGTGTDFVIKQNKFYTENAVLYFRGTNAADVKGNIGNKIGNNVFEGNKIYSKANNISDLIRFDVSDNQGNAIQGNQLARP